MSYTLTPADIEAIQRAMNTARELADEPLYRIGPLKRQDCDRDADNLAALLHRATTAPTPASEPEPAQEIETGK